VNKIKKLKTNKKLAELTEENQHPHKQKYK
jgi:hypothetical protein